MGSTRALVERQGTDGVLACCHGFSISASGRPFGVVETPVFSGKELGPDYLIVRVTDAIPGFFAKVPVALVDEIDPERRRISLAPRLEGVVDAGGV